MVLSGSGRGSGGGGPRAGHNGWREESDHAPPKAGWPSIDEAAARGRGPLAGASTVPLGFRPWRAADAHAFRALLDDAEVWRHLPARYPDPLTEAMAADLIALSNESTHHEVRAILRGDRPVGQVRLEFHEPGSAELSYWLGREFWGQGIAGHAVPRYLDEALRRLSLTRITARVHAGNTASQKVLAACGLVDAGALPTIRGWRLFQRRL